MKNYKAMYIYDVVQRLPKEQREDVSKELESLIDDMMESEQSLEEVLLSLGHPAELASKYREKPRYLISPDSFDQYVATLKLVLPIVAVVGVVLNIIGQFLSSYMDNGLVIQATSDGIRLVSQFISSAIEGGLSFAGTALVAVTIVYAVIDYNQTKKLKRVWHLGDLKEIPHEKLKRISRSETIVGMVFSIIFTGLFLMLLEMNWLAIFRFGSVNEMIVVFNTAVIKGFVPVFLGLFVIGLAIQAYKIIRPYWNFPLAHATLIYNMLTVAVSVVFLSQEGLLTLEFIRFLEVNLTSTLPIVEVVQVTRGIIIMVIVLISVIEVILGYYRAFKNYGLKQA